MKLGDALMLLSKLPLEKVQDAALKGAVWIQRKGQGKILKIRTINELVYPTDKLSFYYDPRILSIPEVKESECLFQDKNFGIWFKDVGVVSQGTQAGDHTSLLRYVEKKLNKETFLVHRLDRETDGLMIIAYNGKAAGVLGDLFQKHLIKKTYQAVVKGTLTPGKKETINMSLDDKEAITHYEVIDSTEAQSLLHVTIETGRLHQIRRHLDGIGYPVMGDPKYGQGNKNRQGLQLLAKSLEFQDPWSQKTHFFEVSKNLTLK
jgi:tRNA pseudouridine32 synthase / 23S rRNA pseudouridine746 synthase